MADQDSSGPSLELPSLFKRKRGKESGDAAEATDPADPTAAAEKPPAPEAAPDPASPTSGAAGSAEDTAVLPTAGADGPAGAATPPEPPASDGAASAARRPRIAPAPLPNVQAPRAGRRVTPPPAPPEPASRPEPQPEPRPGPGPAPAREPAKASRVAGAEEPARPVGGTATRPRDDAAEPTGTPAADQARRRRTLPELAATTAALVVGAAVGLLGVVLTFLGLQGCELVAGTSSCGGPGLLVLVAIFVAMVLAGAAALKVFRVPEAGSVSFLGTGLLMVILLLFLLEALDRPVMLVVVPAIAAPCFALARWVTTQLSEDVMADR